MDINDDVLSMPKGWIVAYNDGTLITEYDRNGASREWKSVPKTNIKYVALKWNNKHWTIAGKDFYLQKKRGWVNPAIPGEQEANIQYRYIGYWEGKNKVFYRVDEVTGEMKMLVDGPPEDYGE
jgi:hypothetical protein